MRRLETLSRASISLAWLPWQGSETRPKGGPLEEPRIQTHSSDKHLQVSEYLNNTLARLKVKVSFLTIIKQGTSAPQYHEV